MDTNLQLIASREFNGYVLDCYVDPDQRDKGDFCATTEQIGRLLDYEYTAEAIRKIYQRNKERLDLFSTRVNLPRVDGMRTIIHEVIMYNFNLLLLVYWASIF